MTRYIEEHASVPDTLVLTDGSVWTTSPYLGCGDYHLNGLVGRANVQALLEDDEIQENTVSVPAPVRDTEIPDNTLAIEVRYAFGGRQIYLSPAYEDRDQILGALADYPVLDDSALSEVEQESEDEAWANWVRADAIALLPNDLRDAAEELDDKVLRTAFEAASDETGIYWEESGGERWIDVDHPDLVGAFTARVREAIVPA